MTYIPISASVATDRDLPVTQGALLVSVTPNSPADDAGLRNDDIIVAIDQRTLDDTTSVLDVLREKKPGDRIEVTVVRDGATQTVEIELGRSPFRAIDSGRTSLFETLRRHILRLFGR